MFSIVTDNPDRNCARPGADPNDWFPDHEPERRHPESRRRYIVRARRLCGGCPVQDKCLEAALAAEAASKYTPAGIYGGHAPWERKAMLGHRGRAAVTS